MEEHRHHSMGDPASPCVFSAKPTRPPRSSNTQGLSGSRLYFLLAILGNSVPENILQQVWKLNQLFEIIEIKER